MEEKTKRTLIVFVGIVILSLVVLLVGGPKKLEIVLGQYNKPKPVKDTTVVASKNLNKFPDSVKVKLDESQFNEIKKLLKPAKKIQKKKRVYKKTWRRKRKKKIITQKTEQKINVVISADSSLINVVNFFKNLEEKIKRGNKTKFIDY